jgi:hypothetical protein
MASSTSFSWCCGSRAKKNAQADAVQLKPRFCSATEAKDTGKFRPFEDSNYFNVQKICRPRFHGAPPEEQKRLLLGSLKTVGIEFPPKSTPHAHRGQKNKRQDALQKVQKQMDNPGPLAMLMWTMDNKLNLYKTQLYKEVNDAILCDDGDQLTHLGDYIAALNYYVDNHHVTEEVTLYTGTSIKKHQQVLCETVSWRSHFLRQPKFLCATKDEKVAERFCENSESPVLQLVVPAGCKFCAPVPSGLSAYPEEGEYLLKPFAAMQLVRQKKRQFPAGSGRERLVVTYNVVEGCAPAAAASPPFGGDRTLPEGIPSCLMKKFRGAYSGEGRDTAAPLKAVALVIGIQDYARGKGLHNTLNDANDMKDKLKSLGFKVTIITDMTVSGGKVTQKTMNSAIRNFVKEVDVDTVAFFCFYGHGAERAGVHYLVPQEMPEAEALEDEAVALKMGVLSRINDKRPLVTVAILDCCREAVDDMRGAFGEGTGLCGQTGPAGTLTLYACDSGGYASDGKGTRNGVFTKALLNHLGTPGETLGKMAKKVRKEVMQRTGDKQQPEHHDRTTEEICLVAAPSRSASANGIITRSKTREENKRLHAEIERLRADKPRANSADYPPRFRISNTEPGEGVPISAVDLDHLKPEPKPEPGPEPEPGTLQPGTLPSQTNDTMSKLCDAVGTIMQSPNTLLDNTLAVEEQRHFNLERCQEIKTVLAPAIDSAKAPTKILLNMWRRAIERVEQASRTDSHDYSQQTYDSAIQSLCRLSDSAVSEEQLKTVSEERLKTALAAMIQFNPREGEKIVSKLHADGIDCDLIKLQEISKLKGSSYSRTTRTSSCCSCRSAGSETCGQFALHKAAKLGELETLSVLLLPEVGIDLNASDAIRGATALHQAAMHGQTKAAKKLLEAAKERNLQRDAFIRATDRKKQTPLHYAAKGPGDRSGHGDRESMIDLLLKNGACPKMRCEGRCQPLHAAAKNIDRDQKNLMEHNKQQFKVIKALFKPAPTKNKILPIWERTIKEVEKAQDNQDDQDFHKAIIRLSQLGKHGTTIFARRR